MASQISLIIGHGVPSLNFGNWLRERRMRIEYIITATCRRGVNKASKHTNITTCEEAANAMLQVPTPVAVGHVT